MLAGPTATHVHPLPFARRVSVVRSLLTEVNAQPATKTATSAPPSQHAHSASCQPCSTTREFAEYAVTTARLVPRVRSVSPALLPTCSWPKTSATTANRNAPSAPLSTSAQRAKANYICRKGSVSSAETSAPPVHLETSAQPAWYLWKSSLEQEFASQEDRDARLSSLTSRALNAIQESTWTTVSAGSVAVTVLRALNLTPVPVARRPTCSRSTESASSVTRIA